MPDNQWFYARGDQQVGPILGQELRQLAVSGELLPDDLVWRDGMQQWAPAAKIKGLFAGSGDTAMAEALEGGQSATSIVSPPVAGQLRATRRPRRMLIVIQGVLWVICVLIVLVGGLLFAGAILRAKDQSQQAAAGAL